MYNISEICFEKCRIIEARRGVVSLSEVLCLRAMLCSCTWSVANWMVQVTRISYRWFVDLFSPYARLWGQLLPPGRECSLLQSCYCQGMDYTARRPYTAPKVLTESPPITFGQISSLTCPLTLKGTSLNSRCRFPPRIFSNWSSQWLVGSRTVSILVVAVHAIMLLFVVLWCSVVINFCCWCMLFREMLHTISILSQCYKPRIFLFN